MRCKKSRQSKPGWGAREVWREFRIARTAMKEKGVNSDQTGQVCTREVIGNTPRVERLMNPLSITRVEIIPQST